ncbi:AraC family transcriptional regulator [Acidaminobacter sp. JC074]|uniref:helix-turn-helix domain-containing protein n=1 Tax=Acidaminobacter sp. JC074 TaxID=2530199 RepID=UPI001F11518E|nr:helix-turn-helix transcriptional regulator [Acidaminobacter sp. JC074]MCH4889556.1 AraC family transcriptional regulator [Acidaminobacter sp. JC074]
MTKAYLIGKEYRKYLDGIGINSEWVFKKAGIPLKVGQSGVYINRDQYIDFMNAIGEVSNIDTALKYCNFSEYYAFVPPIYAGLCARNGIQCFERISKYKQLIGPFVLKVEKTDKSLILTFTFDDKEKTSLPVFTQMTENILMVNLLRTGTGKAIKPIKIEATQQYTSSVSDYLGCQTSLSKVNRIHFSLEDVQEPFLSENNVMWQFLEPEFKKRIQEMEVDESLSAKVRTMLTELIPSGQGHIEIVAKEVAMSSRTLQRKLKEEGTTFIKQLNHTRELMAKNYLINGTISTEEVAYLLDYSDMYVFMRAFKQWTGQTVKEYRDKHALQVS